VLVKRIVYNIVISTGARLINAALAFIIIGFLTRYLGQTGFGQYTTILAFLYIFTVLADLGLYSICIRDISKPGADEEKIISNAFTLRFFAGLVAFGLAPLAAWFFPYAFEVRMGILVGAIGFWLLSNNQVLMGVFQKYLQMDKVALAEVVSRLVQLGLVVFFIYEKLGFLFIVSALVGGAIVNFILVLIFIRKYIILKFSFDFSFWGQLIKEALPLGIAAILVMIYFKLDTVMLSFMKDQIDVGIYGLAYKILENLIFFPAMFVGLIMPLLSKHAFSNRRKFQEISQKTLDILLIITIPLIVGVFFLSSQIINLIGGQDFILSAGVLNILIVAVGIIFIAALFSNMIIALKKQKALTYIYGLGAVINVLTNLIFIPRYSYYGAASTTVLTEFIVTVLMLIIIYRANKTLPSFSFIFKCSFAVLIMALPLYFFRDRGLFLSITSAALTYFGVLYLIGGLKVNELTQIYQESADI